MITTLEMGGAEKLVVDMLPRLRDKGCEVELLTILGKRTPLYERLEQEGIKVHHFGVDAKIYDPLHAWRLVSFLRHHHYDIVHTHNTAPQLLAAVAGVLCSVVLCTTEHTTSNRRRDWKWYKPIDRWMYRQYRSVVCISNQAEANLRDFLGPGRYNISTIFNGIDVRVFADASPCVSLVREKGGKKAVVMVAGFRYEKDQETLIKALARLDRAQYVLWLVGDGKRRDILQSLVDELKLGDSVRFLGVRNDVPRILQAADIVVMSSHFEGLSLSSIEGMSVGKPFVASDVDGLREVVKGYGVLFPHGDDAALAAVIERLGSDAAYAKQVAAKCWERAQMFDIQKTVDAYYALYDKKI